MFTTTHLAEALLDLTPGGHSAGRTLRRLADRAGWKFDPAATDKDQMAGILEQILGDLRSSTLALAHATEDAAVERACSTIWIADLSGITWEKLAHAHPAEAAAWRTNVRAAINAALAAPTTTLEGNAMTITPDAHPTDTTEDTGDGPSELQYLGFLRAVVEEFPDLERHASIELHHATVHEQLAKLTGHATEDRPGNLVPDGQPADLLLEFLDDILVNFAGAVTAPDARITEGADTARKRLLRLAEDHASQPGRANIYIELADRVGR